MLFAEIHYKKRFDTNKHKILHKEIMNQCLFVFLVPHGRFAHIFCCMACKFKLLWVEQLSTLFILVRIEDSHLSIRRIDEII